MDYYGHYRSATVMRGCVKEFTTTKREDLMFPPQVNYYCDMCKDTHAFRLMNMHMIVNTATAKRFDEFCTKNHIEQDIEVPSN
jgi:hypothetical protein